jgi:hypothetical protein
MRAKTFCLVFAVLLNLSACEDGGPEITGCVVNTEKKGFDCVDYPKTKYFVPAGPSDLECIAPDDLELFLKACKKHKALSVTTCKLDWTAGKASCKPPTGQPFVIAIDAANNYFCINGKYKQRILQRCS